MPNWKKLIASGSDASLNSLNVKGTITANAFSGNFQGSIANNLVSANQLNVTGNGTTSQYLRSDGDGSFTWATPPNTTYSVGDGGLTEINFTSTLNTKLAGIAASANNYSLPEATATTRGGIELFSNTDNPTAANAVSSTTGRTYGIQLNSAGQAVVNVPWVDTNTNTTYTAGTGLTLSGTTFSNAAPDQTVSLTGKGATTVSGTYPNFTITSTDTNTNTTYSAGTGLTLTGTTFSLTNTYDEYDSWTIGDGINTEKIGSGATLTIRGAGASVTSYDAASNTLTITSTDTNTDTNTTYSAGAGLTLSGTTFSHTDTSTQTSVNNSGRTYIQDITLDTYGHITGITSATETVVNTDTNTITTLGTEGVAGTPGDFIFIGKGATSVTQEGGNIYVSSTDTDTNTTYSVGDGGLTQKNFTSTLKTKLDGIAAGATNVTNNNQLTNGAGYQTAAQVSTAISNVIDSAPDTLNTLNELAAALGDDPNFATTVSTSIGTKLAKASNLSDLADVGTARTNLGLGSLATLSSVNAATITDNSVGAAELNVTGNGTTSQFLRSDGDGTFTWATPTDTNTTYTVGDGGLTQKNFTTTLFNKLNGIAASADNYGSWTISDGANTEGIGSGATLTIRGAGASTAAYDAASNTLTISSTDTNTDTNTTYSAGSGITLSGTTFSHTDTSSQGSVNNSGRTYIQDITLDTYGHITGIVSATETVVNTDTNTITQIGTEGVGLAPGDFTFVGKGATTITQEGDKIYVSSTDTDTNTTYSVGNGGLTEINFTSALNTKLAGIAASANNYSLPEATSTVRGGIELFSDTDNPTAANAVSSTTGRTYGIQLNSAGQAVVNVPWVDTNTNTTYSAGSGITLSGTTFSNAAPDQTVTLTGKGATTISGTYPNFTITSTDTDTNTTYSVGNGGLTEINFTSALNTKLAGIAAGATNVTNNNQLTNGAGYLTSTNDRVYLTDSRGGVRLPSFYDDRYAQWDFQSSADTEAGGDGWHAIQTISKWTAFDATHRQEQLIFTGDNLKRRTAASDTAWGELKTVWDSGNLNPVVSATVSNDTTTFTKADGSTFALTTSDANSNTVTSVGISGDLSTGNITLVGTGATSITKSAGTITINSTDTNTNTTYTAGTGLTLVGTEFRNAAPDQTVTLTGKGATTVSGTYPNFTITSTDTDTDTNTWRPVDDTPRDGQTGVSISSNWAFDNVKTAVPANAKFTDTTYSVGNGGLTEINFTSALNTKLAGIAAGATNVTNNNQLTNGAGYITSYTDTNTVTSIRRDNTGTYRTGNINLVGGSNVTITETSAGVFSFASTDTNTNTTYSAGSGITLSGTTFSNAAPDQTVSLTGAGATTISGTYPNFTITSTDTNTDTNTTYSAGGGLTLSGTTFSHTDTSTQGSVNNSGRTYIQDITLDTYGHITGITSATETVVNTDTNTITQIGTEGVGLAPGNFTFVGKGATTIFQEGDKIYVSSTDTDTNTTYSVGDGGLTQKNFTTTLFNKLNGIAAGATNVTNNNQLTNGAGYITSYVNTTYSAGSGLSLSGTTFSVQNDLRGEAWLIGPSTSDYINVTDTYIDFVLDSAVDMRLYNNGTLHVEGDVIAYSTTISDERLKDDVTTIQNPLDKIKALRGVEYIWNAGSRSGKRDLGLIAQEVEMVIPEIVHDHELPLIDGESGTVYKTVDYEKMVAVLIEGMKEQQSQIDELKSEISKLKGEA